MSSTDPTTIGVHRALHEALIAAREAQHRFDEGDAAPDLDDLVELATLLAGLSESVTAVNSGMIARARAARASASSVSTSPVHCERAHLAASLFGSASAATRTFTPRSARCRAAT